MPFNYQAQPLPILTPGQMNPFNEAVKQGLSTFQEGVKAGYLPSQMKEKLLAAQLENQINQVKAKYAAPMAEQNLSKIQQENQWYGPNMESAIAGRKATTNLTNKQLSWYDRMRQSELAKAQREAENPLLSKGGTAGDIGAMIYLQQHPELQRLMNPGQQGGQMGVPQQGQLPPQPMQQMGSPQQQQIPNIPGMPSFGQQAQPQMSPFAPPAQQQAPQAPQAPQQQNPYNNPNLMDTMRNSMFANLKAKQAVADLNMQKAQGYKWNQLTAEMKNEIGAQGAGMGIDAPKMEKYINEGLGIREIAEREGLDPDNLPKKYYPPTNQTKSRNQQVEAVGAELDYLNSNSTALIKPYANTIGGFSTQLKLDQLNPSPEVQKRVGKYYAGLALRTGIANGQVLQEGGRPGVTLMKMVKDSTLRGIDQSPPWKMSDIAFQSASDELNKVLKKGAKFRTESGQTYFPKKEEKAEKGSDSTAQYAWKNVGTKENPKFEQVAR